MGKEQAVTGRRLFLCKMRDEGECRLQRLPRSFLYGLGHLAVLLHVQRQSNVQREVPNVQEALLLSRSAPLAPLRPMHWRTGA